MAYTKPEVTVLGDALQIVLGDKPDAAGEGSLFTNEPAYELDE